MVLSVRIKIITIIESQVALIDIYRHYQRWVSSFWQSMQCTVLVETTTLNNTTSSAVGTCMLCDVTYMVWTGLS